MAKKRVAVLFGGAGSGASEDREISLKSAHSVLRALSASSKYDLLPVGITKAGRWLYFPGNYSAILDGTWEFDDDCCSAILSPDPLHGGLIKIMDEEEGYSLHKLDAVFPLLNGKFGECGQIQALCKLSGISYVGSGFAAANACFDKALSHLILNKAGINTAKYYCLERVDIDKLEEKFAAIEATVGYPVNVRAAVANRSAGTYPASNREELKSAIKLAFSGYHKIVIEEVLKGKELECVVWGSVYRLNVSSIVEASETSEFKEIVRAKLEAPIKQKIEETAKTAFLALGCSGFAKTSFRLENDGLRLIKVDCAPDFSEKSVFSALMRDGGYLYKDMLDMFVESAKEA